MGKMRTGTDRDAKEVGSAVATFSRNTETAGLNGEPYPFPRSELRLNVEVYREGDRIAVARISLEEIASQLSEFMADYVRWKEKAQVA